MDLTILGLEMLICIIRTDLSDGVQVPKPLSRYLLLSAVWSIRIWPLFGAVPHMNSNVELHSAPEATIDFGPRH